MADAGDNPGLVSDCETLLAARDTLAGTATLHWSADAPISDWDGGTVDGTPPRITPLYLPENRLTGTIPAELANLDNLQELYLWGNQLTGSIPAGLSDFANLEGLNLSYNQLTGPIPAELSDLANLEGLNLSYNQLIGPIPAVLRSPAHGLAV